MYAYVRAFFDSLGTSVGHVCVSPGSRSTPLAVSAARHEGLRCWVHVDERSAGFFALGLARASRSPVALICTSGTAAANYLPAIVEANHSRVPLVVLTADRPPELRDWDAGQTIDQLKLYGDQVRWFAEVPVPGDDPALLRHARSLGSRAASEAMGQGGSPGPVHLNWPLREPLDPTAGPRVEAKSGEETTRRPAVAVRPAGVASGETLGELVALARETPRGVIVCGPLDGEPALAAAIDRLGRAAGWPVVADGASNLRAGDHAGAGSAVVANGDFLLRPGRFAEARAPDGVVRFGATPVSKALRLWLEARPPREYVVVDPCGGFSDPSHLATRTLAVDARDLCDRWAASLPPGRDDRWLEGWRGADERAASAVRAVFEADDRLLEPRAVRDLCDALPEDALLYVSNSMPIRYLDACLPRGERRIRALVNRGANGIDGVISSALGAAAADVGPTVLLTGDLALVHDLGGLLAGSRHGLRLTIVVLDNDGGGIFSYLPIAAHGEDVSFEALFRTAHGLDFEHAARLFRAGYQRVTCPAHYRAALKDALAAECVSIVHVPTDRDASIEQFRALAAGVAAP
jgi:2-succinyl-5-enolpyruvyl-6-hydroxy-3-cyclohexene-1-carboxylate synthase